MNSHPPLIYNYGEKFSCNEDNIVLLFLVNNAMYGSVIRLLSSFHKSLSHN